MSARRSGQGLLIGAAAVIAALLIIAPAGQWPWDHDEVHSLVELQLVPLHQFPGPSTQLERMHRLVPVFYGLQHLALLVVPQNEWGMRLLPATCGALVTLVAFVIGWRWRGFAFGVSLFLLLVCSQTLIWLSQQNRFYSLALLFASIEFAAVYADDDRWTFDALAIAAGVLAILSHNVTLILFGLSCVAITATWFAGWTTRTTARRSLLVMAAIGLVYLFYLRPLTAGWTSGDTGGTSVLLSFFAQAGIAPVALAVPGAISVLHRKDAPRWSSWILFAVLSVVFVAVSPRILGSWNPRYGLFFMMPLWMLAAAGSEAVMRALPSDRLRVAWLIAVVALLAPKLASHYVDGSRHDFRTAAAVVAAHDAGTESVLTNWPAELQYYLEPRTGQRPRFWMPGDAVPDAGAVIVFSSNAWEPVVQVPGRQITVVSEVGRPRFDEQSHLIRIYRVAPR